MKLKIVCLSGLLLLVLTGCGSINPSQPLATQPTSESSFTSPLASESVEAPVVTKPAAPSPTHPELAQAPQPDAETIAEAPTIQRDYAPTSPLPSTGQVTLRGNIRNMETDRLIAECPPDSAPYAFAESTNYIVQICSAEYDPWMPKYYLGHAKADGTEIWLTNEEHETARQLIFENSDYTYVLYRDTNPNETNAYLEVHTPDGTVYAEALLYFYERTDRPGQ